MDFFDQQDKSRKQTGVLLFYFTLAVIITIVLVYFVPVCGWHALKIYNAPPDASIQLHWWNTELFLGVCGVTLLVVLGGAGIKMIELARGGGRNIAEMLGGKEILPDTNDFFERRLRNVVEEMSIASGVPVPSVYVMEREEGVNAFAAGFNISNAVVAVTHGTMTGLTRDELQGVVAHEFSHILNNDMAINLKLMGFLHGLLLIGLTGQILLRLGSGSGHHHSNSRKGSPQIFGLGLCLLVVGYTGVLFANLIKASISRSRERLADASAVQFTRNPAGLASALKKIGGLSTGSFIRSAKATEASHLFFSKGSRGSIFSTHPPLAERVRWLDPHFNGDFERVTYEDLRTNLHQFEGAPEIKEKEQPDVVDLFTQPQNIAVAGAVLETAKPSSPQPTQRPNNPEALIDSIGKPMEHHAEVARALIDSIPENIKAHARDPYGARMLIYGLLLDADEEIRNKQLAILKDQADPEVYNIVEKTLPELESITPEMRLPIIDLSMPALRLLSAIQYKNFRHIMKTLIMADEKIDIHEGALYTALTHHLDPVFSGKAKPRPLNYYAIRGLEQETSVILSLLARTGNSPEEQEAAFESAVGKINAPRTNFDLLPEDECGWEQFNEALNKFNEASFKVKRWLLGGALACLMYDKKITVEEVELFRIIADTLGCPVPPWVAPTKTRDAA
ncbi:MAG TPA: M48 family metallopeptidase [Pontiella sp.]